MRSWAMWTFGIDPMMRKEFYGVSRRWQTYFHRAAYVGILGLVVWAMWMTYRSFGRIDYSAYAELGRMIFVVFAWVQFFLIALSALSASSDLISKEVRGGTLGILAITPISSWRLVLGKWKSCVGYLFIIVLSGIPVLSLGIYLGGVEAMELLRVSALTVSSAMMCAAFGMLCSAMFRNSYVCMIASALGMVVYTLLPALLAVVLQDWNLEDDIFLGACHVEPIYALGVYLMSGGRRMLTGTARDWAWICASSTSVLLTFAFLAMAARRVGRLVTAEPRPPLLRRMFEGLDRLFESSRFGMRLLGDSGVWNGNPFLWKELHSRLTGKLRYFTRIAVVMLIAFTGIVLLIVNDIGDTDVLMTGLLILMILTLITSVGSGAGSFTKEKEEGKFDILLTTPMKPGAIVGAKLAGATTGTAHFAAMLLLFAGIASFVSGDRDRLFVPVVTSTLVFTYFVLGLGVLFSLMLPSTRKAYSLTLGVVIFIVVVIPLMLALVSIVMRVRDQDFVMFLLRATNPFVHLEGMQRYRNNESEIWAGLVAFVVLYSFLGTLCIGTALSKFNRLVGRGR